MRRALVRGGFDAWRSIARDLLAAGVPPRDVAWIDGEDGQEALPSDEAVGGATNAPSAPSGDVFVPPAFLALAEKVACHREPARWEVLYGVLWRLARAGERGLLSNAVDEDVHRLGLWEKAVRRDVHKMKAFVRFRRIEVKADDGAVQERYIAWHRPDHRIMPLAAPFFARRFGTLRWSILTPVGSAHWDGVELAYGPALTRRDAPSGDALEELWTTYYSNIFNPARIKLGAMVKEMPVRYWAALPEAAVIDRLLREAPRRVEDMMARQVGLTVTAADFLPAQKAPSLPILREAASACRGCDLYKNATQTVFGEGPPTARVMFVGEQPGDQEDVAGRPFIGPAGQVFADALAEAGIDRATVYVTNAVKHFKWEPAPRGTRRIHKKPDAREVRACKPWLEQEIGAVRPEIVVCLGATAAQAMMGAGFRVTQDRGRWFEGTPWAARWMATIHPSAILRMPDEATKAAAYRDFVADLGLVAAAMM